MADELKILWEATPTALTVTNLASLADGNLWRSGEITDASPSHELLRISYEIVFNATPIAGDTLHFFLASGDEAASGEIWDGGIATTEGQITTAQTIAEALAALGFPAHQHAWQTSHGTTFRGHMDLFFPGPSWQVLVRPLGEALAASGHTIRRRYGTFQRQS